MVIGVIGNSIEQRAAQKELAEAHRLWEAGQKAEAVAKYNHALTKKTIEKSDLPTVYERVIDFHAEQGDATSVQALLDAAQKQRITLALNRPRTKQFLAQIQQEKAAKEEADRKVKAGKDEADRKAKAEKEAEVERKWQGTFKVQALKKLIAHLERSPRPPNEAAFEQVGQEELRKREQWVSQAKTLLKEFTDKPFDPKAFPKEAESIVQLFDRNVAGKYSGEVYDKLKSHVTLIHDGKAILPLTFFLREQRFERGEMVRIDHASFKTLEECQAWLLKNGYKVKRYSDGRGGKIDVPVKDGKSIWVIRHEFGEEENLVDLGRLPAGWWSKFERLPGPVD